MEGAAQGDHGQPPARRLRLPLARRLARRRVEGVGERRNPGVEGILELQEGSEARRGLGGGQGLQDLDGERDDAQEGEPAFRRRRGAQEAPPPS
ncbi:MAG TPA: hypothetical protein VGH73_02035 [Thermoanaerobaculia bacterium]